MQPDIEEGDVRVANLVQGPGARPDGRRALAWRPWLRGFFIGAPLWLALGAAVALWWASLVAEEAVRPSVPDPVYPTQKESSKWPSPTTTSVK